MSCLFNILVNLAFPCVGKRHRVFFLLTWLSQNLPNFKRIVSLQVQGWTYNCKHLAPFFLEHHWRFRGISINADEKKEYQFLMSMIFCNSLKVNYCWKSTVKENPYLFAIFCDTKMVQTKRFLFSRILELVELETLTFSSTDSVSWIFTDVCICANCGNLQVHTYINLYLHKFVYFVKAFRGNFDLKMLRMLIVA